MSNKRIQTMLEFIKNYMRKPTPLELISQELAVAHLAKLEAETAVDYAVSIVNYNTTRIARLNKHLKAYTNGLPTV